MLDMLKERGAEHIRVFGGGGGVIIPEEIRQLEAYGVERIYSPQMGQAMGLQGIIDDMISRARQAFDINLNINVAKIKANDRDALATAITAIEQGAVKKKELALVKEKSQFIKTPVLGITDRKSVV